MLKNFDVFQDRNWYWIGAASLLGFTVLFNLLFTVTLTYFSRKQLPNYEKFPENVELFADCCLLQLPENRKPQSRKILQKRVTVKLGYQGINYLVLVKEDKVKNLTM